MDLVTEFVRTTKETKEQLRGLAVQMVENSYTYREIQSVLNVSLGFISKWNKIYQLEGVSGLKLRYCGTKGYLTDEQKQEVVAWLKTRKWWSVEEVAEHVQQSYDVIFESKQSYYHLLHLSELSWKKSQPTHPKKDDQLVAQKN